MTRRDNGLRVGYTGAVKVREATGAPVGHRWLQYRNGRLVLPYKHIRGLLLTCCIVALVSQSWLLLALACFCLWGVYREHL